MQNAALEVQTDEELLANIDSMLEAVLGTKQICTDPELENLTGKHAQTHWRWRKEGFIPKPLKIQGRNHYTRPQVRQILLHVFKSQ